MKTTKFFAIVTMAFMMFMPSLSSGQAFYLYAEFIPGNSENVYFEDWTLCWEWGASKSGTIHLPMMGDKIPKNESFILSANEFEDPTMTFTINNEFKGDAGPLTVDYFTNKRKFPLKLALCNAKGEPEAMYMLYNAQIARYEENDDKLDLALNFEHIEFTSIPSEFQFSQKIYLWVDGIEGDSKNEHLTDWIFLESVAYDMRDIPSKMNLLTLDTDKLETISLNEDQLKGAEMIIDFGKWVDKSSAALLQNYFRDKKVFPAKIAIVNEGEEGAFVYELKNVMITNYEELEINNRYTLEFSEIYAFWEGFKGFLD